MTGLDCRTSGQEDWMLDAYLDRLALAREGGLTVSIPHRCMHHEVHDYAPPEHMRRLANSPCSRCLLAQEGEP